MADFWKGFNQGFSPYVGNIGDIISNVMMYDYRKNQNFYNDMAQENQRRITQQEAIRAKQEAERQKILETKKYHETNQSVLEGLLNQYDEKKFASLPDEYQNKYNRIIKNRIEPEIPTITRDDFVDASQISGLEHLKGYKVKRTQKLKGENLVDLSYSQPFKKEDTERITKPNGVEELSKVEKSQLAEIEKNILNHEGQLAKAQTYGAITNKDGEPITPSELKEVFRSQQAGMTESLKNLLGKKGLKPYDQAFNTYRNKESGVVAPENLPDSEYALYVKDLVEGIDESYKNKEISAADYKVYQLLLRVDLGLDMQTIKGLLNAR